MGLTKNQVLAQAVLFFVAGYDTTTIAMSMAVYYLAQHKHIQERLIEEIEDVRKNQSDITYEVVMGLEYLDAVCSEVLRMNPPVQMTYRTCVESTVLGNIAIDKGTFIRIPIFAMQHDEKYFVEPDVFNPDSSNQLPMQASENVTNSPSLVASRHDQRRCSDALSDYEAAATRTRSDSQATTKARHWCPARTPRRTTKTSTARPRRRTPQLPRMRRTPRPPQDGTTGRREIGEDACADAGPENVNAAQSVVMVGVLSRNEPDDLLGGKMDIGKCRTSEKEVAGVAADAMCGSAAWRRDSEKALNDANGELQRAKKKKEKKEQ
ncbi:hypothetical protein HPB51_007400 [Rhipicephalus microplus]|uniref:Cytochrome n=1 Tax=Rhipicephalus microplus TaxID=6941 RepID=A0A9J6EYH3_RHIMP|nr:hypothetical protein HPB51_007400 [Rhipicephalus microplus]